MVVPCERVGEIVRRDGKEARVQQERNRYNSRYTGFKIRDAYCRLSTGYRMRVIRDRVRKKPSIGRNKCIQLYTA